MSGRNKRASLRVRLAVAAAVLVGGGAAAVAGVVATHSSATTQAQSAGYYQHMGRSMDYTDAISSAMNGWDSSQSNSLMTLSHMKPMHNTLLMTWHRHTLAFQRGIVVAESIRQKEIVVQSANGRIETWHWNGGTTAVNVGNNSTGWSAMTGGTMSMPSWWNGHLNLRAKAAIKGDMVFVFGQQIKGKLIAQLVLFAAPMTNTQFVTPTATPTATPTVTPTATTSTIPTAPATSTATGNTQPTHF